MVVGKNRRFGIGEVKVALKIKMRRTTSLSSGSIMQHVKKHTAVITTSRLFSFYFLSHQYNFLCTRILACLNGVVIHSCRIKAAFKSNGVHTSCLCFIIMQ